MESFPAPDPGELGYTILTDVLVGESSHVRVLARQAVVFNSCIALRLELVRAPGSSTETWWKESRAAARQRNIISDTPAAVDLAGGFRLEIVEGTRLVARDGARGSEDRLVVDYVVEKPKAAQVCVLRVQWPDFGIHDAQLTIPV